MSPRCQEVNLVLGELIDLFLRILLTYLLRPVTDGDFVRQLPELELYSGELHSRKAHLISNWSQVMWHRALNLSSTRMS